MKSNQLPYFALFESFKSHNDFDLGLSDYFTLLEALQSGFVFDETKGKATKEKLLELCQLLWLKPYHSPRLFDEVFEIGFNTLLLEEEKIEKKDEDNIEQPKTEQNAEEETKEIDNKHKEEKQPDTSNESKETENIKQKNDNLDEKIRLHVSLGDKVAKGTNDNQNEAIIENRTFLFSDDYYPIDERKLIQTWRMLPTKVSGNYSNNINIEKIVQDIANKGFFERLHYKKQQNTVNKVLFLADHQGSMIAFEGLRDTIFDCIKIAFEDYNQAKNNVENFYFHNVPQDYIYRNKSHTDYISMDDFIKNNKNKSNVMMIFSDAGAARDNNSNNRVRSTIRSIFKLQELTQKIIWLNPLPKERWKGNGAERIARFVNMYEANEQGVLEALRFLKGKCLTQQY